MIMPNKYMFLTDIIIHDTWGDFFNKKEVQHVLTQIELEINKDVTNGNNFTPNANKVLRFATTDLSKVRVLWLGKDPYPQLNVATGRSFEVDGVTTWLDGKVNSSLKNIIKLINKSYTGKEKSDSIEKVRSEINDGIFKIPTPDVAFDYWEKQGVLFLNTAFTCRVGDLNEAGSHIKLWKPFFNILLDYMTEKNTCIKYFLWGQAKKYSKPLQKRGVKESDIYTSKHPCTNGDTGVYANGSNFLNCPCFLDTKKTELKDGIDWI